MKVNKQALMIRLVNRITDERNYWRAKCEALHSQQPFAENERYERRRYKIARISRLQWPVSENIEENIGKLFVMSINATIFVPSNKLNHLV